MSVADQPQVGACTACGSAVKARPVACSRPGNEAPHEDRSKRREAERLPDEEPLDHAEHQAQRGANALARVVARLGPKPVDTSGVKARCSCCSTASASRFKSRLCASLRYFFWSSGCSCSSRFRNRTSVEQSRVISLSRYVTRKGSGHGDKPVLTLTKPARSTIDHREHAQSCRRKLRSAAESRRSRCPV